MKRFLLAAGHACVDVYQGMVAALVPLFVAEREYTYAAVSGIVLAASVLSSVAQPVFGWLADRWPMPWLLPVGTLLGGVGIAISGLVHSYPLILLFVGISSLGIAAYHPEAARQARRASAGSHTAMAWFAAGGNIGFALAPLTVAAVGSLAWTPMLVVPALAGAAMALPVLRGRAGSGPGMEADGTDDLRSFTRLTVAVIFRSITFVGLSTFLALFAGTIALFVLYLGGLIGSLAGGWAATRWGRVKICRLSYAMTVLAVAGLVWIPGPAVYVFVALTSAGLYLPFSLQVTLAQDYLPTRVGTASGITLGLTVSVGGLVSPLIGRLADATSLRTALIPLIVTPAVSWLAFRTLRDPERVPA